MSKAKKKKKGHRAVSEAADPQLYALTVAEAEGDNRRAAGLAEAVMEDVDASPEAKEAALATKQRIAYDPVALAFAIGGALGWGIVFYAFLLS